MTGHNAVHPSSAGKHKLEDHGPGQPGIKQGTISKIANTKWAGRVVEAIECPPSYLFYQPMNSLRLGLNYN
jgi:hypothetical protein